MLRLLIMPFLILVTGCASTAGYEKYLNAWVGSDENELVRKWGPPIQTREAGARRFISYSSQRNIQLPGMAQTIHITVVGNTAIPLVVPGSPSTTLSVSCQTTFELEGAKVVAWSHKGNDCLAKE